MGLSSIVSKKATLISKLQTGYLYHYTFLMLIGLTMVLGVRQFWTFTGNFIDFKIFILFFVLISFLYKK